MSANDDAPIRERDIASGKLLRRKRGETGAVLPIKPRVRKLKIEESSGNVYADLGLPNPASLYRKSAIMIDIVQEVRRRRFSQQDATARMNLSEDKFVQMSRGHFHVISERKMKECLQQLLDSK